LHDDGRTLGALNVLIPNPRDIGGLMKTLSRFKIHFFPGVNTLFNAMLNHPDIKLLDLSELQIALVAWRYNRLSVTAGRNTGKPILEGYGLSASPSATLSHLAWLVSAVPSVCRYHQRDRYSG
jgi:long-chain acyl-CoA synthetase